MKKIALVTLGLALAVLTFAQSEQGRRGGPREGGRGDRKEMMAERLNLSDQQKEQMESLRTKHLSEVQGIENELDIKRAQLKAAVSSEESRKVVDGYVQDINSLTSQRFEKDIDHMLEVRAILDEDQKVIFDSMSPRKGHRRHHKR